MEILQRAALDCVQKGWGVATIVGSAGKGVELSFPPIQLLVGRKLRGALLGGLYDALIIIYINWIGSL